MSSILIGGIIPESDMGTNREAAKRYTGSRPLFYTMGDQKLALVEDVDGNIRFVALDFYFGKDGVYLHKLVVFDESAIPKKHTSASIMRYQQDGTADPYLDSEIVGILEKYSRKQYLRYGVKYVVATSNEDYYYKVLPEWTFRPSGVWTHTLWQFETRGPSLVGVLEHVGMPMSEITRTLSKRDVMPCIAIISAFHANGITHGDTHLENFTRVPDYIYRDVGFNICGIEYSIRSMPFTHCIDFSRTQTITSKDPLVNHLSLSLVKWRLRNLDENDSRIMFPYATKEIFYFLDIHKLFTAIYKHNSKTEGNTTWDSACYKLVRDMAEKICENGGLMEMADFYQLLKDVMVHFSEFKTMEKKEDFSRSDPYLFT